MSTLTNYSGLQLLTPHSPGPGGNAINTNFKALATRVAAGVPGSDADSTQGFSAGSRWFDTSTASEWICLSATPGAPSWVIVTGVLGDYLPLTGGTLAGDLNLGGNNVNANTGGGTGGGTWNLDLGTLSNVYRIYFYGDSGRGQGASKDKVGSNKGRRPN